MKILVIKFRNIGDVLLTTPLFDALADLHPNATIDAAVNEGTEAMLQGHPAIRKLHVYRRNTLRHLPPHLRVLAELRFVISIRRERYDMVINTTKGDRGLWLGIISGASTLIAALSDKNRWLRRFVDHTLPSLNGRHMVDVALDPVRALGHEPIRKRVSIQWCDDTEASVRTHMNDHGLVSKTFIHFHPVSRWLFKCLDDRTAARIIDFCRNDLGVPVVLTAAPVDKERRKIDAILAH